MQIFDIKLDVAVKRREINPRSINSSFIFSTASNNGFRLVFLNQVLSRWMDLSTSKETTTKMVSTEATDQVGVKAKDRISSSLSVISHKFLRWTFRYVPQSSGYTPTRAVLKDLKQAHQWSFMEEFSGPNTPWKRQLKKGVYEFIFSDFPQLIKSKVLFPFLLFWVCSLWL